MNGLRGERAPLLEAERGGRGKRDGASEDQVSDLEHGDGVPAANVGFFRVFSLAKPEAGNLVIGTGALLIAATSSILVQKYGGKIIDIVSGDLRTQEQRDAALNAVKNTIIEIFLIVFLGYEPCLITLALFNLHSTSGLAIFFC
ncbi:hypothetical protein Ahy_A01g000228 isoform A [Arachis hypogaea]|uniref:Uncharacterized protein n=1 Tax=Arachis hypogaea TaxID=3818 RepID=A0A445EJK5_ARAHY|nr:hypothetical protein Ahy_A01g000228 isoform A [Arachis hypogaea]